MTLLPFPQADLQPLDHVLAVLDLTEVGKQAFEANSLPGPNNRVYGGQVLAQALIAAARTLPTDAARCPHSLHAYFLRMGRLDLPIELQVETLHDGKSFSARRVLASQSGKAILTMTASFQESQDGVDFALEMPEAPDPESLPSNEQAFETLEHPATWMLFQAGAFDVRHVEPQIYFPNGAETSSKQMVWMRSRQPLPDRTSQLTQRALLTYACDQIALEPVLRSTGLRWTTPELAVASLDHAMWFHRPVNVRDWLLYVQDAPSSQGGRGLGRAQIFNRAGELVASFAQEGMIRVPQAPQVQPPAAQV